MTTVKDVVEFIDENYVGARVIVAGVHIAGVVRYIVHEGSKSYTRAEF
jgi:hypothetical protein